MTVHQVELRSWTGYKGTRHDGVTVELYREQQLTGQCEKYPGDQSRQILNCEKVAADKVLLRTTSTEITYLQVFMIRVIGAAIVSKTIGLNH